MDVYCRVCGEPFDNDEFHDVPGMTYREASRAFLEQGCKGIGFTCSASVASPEIGIIADLLGDDVDGIASMYEDFLV